MKVLDHYAIVYISYHVIVQRLRITPSAILTVTAISSPQPHQRPSPFWSHVTLPPPLLATSPLLPSYPIAAFILQPSPLFPTASILAPFSVSTPYHPASSSASSITIATPALNSRPPTSRVSSDTPIPLLPPPSTSSSSSPSIATFHYLTMSPPPQQLPLPPYCRQHAALFLPSSTAIILAIAANPRRVASALTARHLPPLSHYCHLPAPMRCHPFCNP
ncbi:hypothetical protein B296_00000040 [Ensete ventricosum]|uniref:Uncharacterized protein n=1 Tax=Ensete ventricosum TaxID=4639 RepID=A0A427AWN5_ENSVE|nr:hypothetical protein B296_00000040 [Ensete ventricosum]